MTATQVIKQLKALPPRERAKVHRFVYANHVPNATTRKVLAAAEAGHGLVRSQKSRRHDGQPEVIGPVKTPVYTTRFQHELA